MVKLQKRRVYATRSVNYFGWDLRETDWNCVWWQRSPVLSDEACHYWPYRLECGEDKKPDVCITVEGDPSDDLLTTWLEEEEKGAELSNLAEVTS